MFGKACTFFLEVHDISLTHRWLGTVVLIRNGTWMTEAGTNIHLVIRRRMATAPSESDEAHWGKLRVLEDRVT